MTRIARRSILLALYFCMPFLGCAESTETVVNQQAVSPLKHSTLAVLEFVGDATISGLTVGAVEEGLIKCKFSIVDRERIRSLLHERKETEINYQKIGKLLSVDYFVSGTVHGGYVWGKAVAKTANYKVIESQTGKIQAIGSVDHGWPKKAGEIGSEIAEKLCKEVDSK